MKKAWETTQIGVQKMIIFPYAALKLIKKYF